MNAENLPESFKFSVAGSSETIYSTDFNDRIDIVPVSEPNIFSTAQRIAQAQAILEMARSAPELHDVYEAYKRMYEAIRIPNIDEILKKPKDAPRLDPIDENMSLLYGKPIRAFPEQDHDSHIAVHVQFISDPSLAGNPGAKALQPILIAHIAEHVALLYRSRMEASIGMSLPNLPDIRDKDFSLEDIDPQMDMLISQRAAQVVQQAPKMQEIKALAAMGQGSENPLQYAQQLAQLEAESLKLRTQAEIQSDQAKAQSDIQTNQAKAQSDIQIGQAKAQQNMEIAAMKLQADLQSKVQKLEAELQIEREKNIMKVQQEITNG